MQDIELKEKQIMKFRHLLLKYVKNENPDRANFKSRTLILDALYFMGLAIDEEKFSGGVGFDKFLSILAKKVYGVENFNSIQENQSGDCANDKVVMPRELTAENGAKYLMLGEFYVEQEVANPDFCGCRDPICDCCMDNIDEPETYVLRVPIDWKTLKAIYAKAVDHLAV